MADESLPESHPILCQAQHKTWNYFPVAATPQIVPEFTPQSSEYCRNQQMKTTDDMVFRAWSQIGVDF